MNTVLSLQSINKSFAGQPILKNLNLDVPFMENKLASTENLVVEFWNILQPRIAAISSAQLHSLKLYETPRNYVEYFGE